MLFLGVMILVISCESDQNKAKNAHNQTDKAYTLDYLAGNWKVNGMNNYEFWEKISEQYYKGISYSLNMGDTTIMEEIEIKVVNGKLFYIPTVFNQNQGKPVYFAHNPNDKKGFLFENPTHDSPKAIGYYPMNENQMNVSISGTANIDLVMVRK